MNWFECKISYDKVNQEGLQKKVIEAYLLDALTFTEAESRIIEEIKPFISGDFQITDIKKVRFAETFLDGTGDKYYKVKIIITLIDEKAGKEKKTSQQILTRASSLQEALELTDEGMKGSMSDYEITAVNETALMDVFQWAPQVVVNKAEASSEEKSE